MSSESENLLHTIYLTVLSLTKYCVNTINGHIQQMLKLASYEHSHKIKLCHQSHFHFIDLIINEYNDMKSIIMRTCSSGRSSSSAARSEPALETDQGAPAHKASRSAWCRTNCSPFPHTQSCCTESTWILKSETSLSLG